MQSFVLHWPADREVVKALKLVILESHHVMDWVVKKTTNARRPDTMSLCLKIKDLSHHPGFPVKMSVKKWRFFDTAAEVCNHAE